VHLTVDFDCQALLQTHEVQHVTGNWKLPAKSEPTWPLPQLLPKQNLGKGHLAAKLASKSHVA
jgi:hypothetical protein